MENAVTVEKFVLQEAVPFSESVIWELQRQYYAEMGAEAWRQGEVPHYVTTNLRQANAYAEMIVALYHDHLKKAGVDAFENEPLRIIELGAGSGRLGYYLLRRLDVLCEQEGIPRTAIHCTLTDFTQSNLDSWRHHPRFQDYYTAGVLDIAILDVVNPGPIALQVSGKVIMQPQGPAVLIANYLFDSIPQELILIDEGNCHRILATTSLPVEFANKGAGEVLEQLEIGYSLAEPVDDFLNVPPLAAIKAEYCRAVAQAYVLFPAAAIGCLEYFKVLFPKGLLLLTADKGGHELPSVLFPSPPAFATHGSFSLNVNYHALRTYCSQLGGHSFFPDYQYSSVNTGFMLLMSDASTYTSTLAAGKKWLDDAGPDAYFTMYKFLRSQLETSEIRDILSALRLSMYDSHQLGIYVYRIANLLPRISRNEAADLINVMYRCWENYFALGEGNDLATTLGSICYELDAYDWALFYFGQSTDIYGGYTGTFYNMAVCYHMLGQRENAEWLLQKVVAHDFGNEAAWKLLAEYQMESVPSL